MAQPQLVFEEESCPLFFSEGISTDENCNVQADWPPSRLMEEFANFSLVAQGGYGIVFRAWNLIDGCQYAIKIIYHGVVEDALTEVKVHAQLNHCNIVGYKTCWLEPCSAQMHELISTSSDSFTNSMHFTSREREEESDSQVRFSFSEDSKTLVPYQYEQEPKKLTLVIQMELCDGTLRDWLDGTVRPTDVSRHLWFTYRRLRSLIMFWDVMNGVETIHLNGLVHHDIKPSNVFMVEGGGIKIGDFGLACGCDLPDREHRGVGTESYAAPEQFHDGVCTPKSDIFSCGLILLEMLLSPFDTVSERHAVLQGLRSSRQLPELISHQNTDLSDLIFEMTRDEWRMRPCASTVKERLVRLMIPIAQQMYSELMKALTTSVLRKLDLSETSAPTVQSAVSPSAAFMLDILDDLSVVGFVQPGQYRDDLTSEQTTELRVKVMLENKMGRYSPWVSRPAIFLERIAQENGLYLRHLRGTL